MEVPGREITGGLVSCTGLRQRSPAFTSFELLCSKLQLAEVCVEVMRLAVSFVAGRTCRFVLPDCFM